MLAHLIRSLPKYSGVPQSTAGDRSPGLRLAMTRVKASCVYVCVLFVCVFVTLYVCIT